MCRYAVYSGGCGGGGGGWLCVSVFLVSDGGGGDDVVFDVDVVEVEVVEVLLLDVDAVSVAGCGCISRCVVSPSRGAMVSVRCGSVRFGSPTVPVVSGPRKPPDDIGVLLERERGVERGALDGIPVGSVPATVPGCCGAVDMLLAGTPGSVNAEVVSTAVSVTPTFVVPTVLVLVPSAVVVPVA
jgi:hypothetical protein